MIKVCKIHCLSEAQSPITHMMGTSGNEAVINRESVLYNGSVRQVPVLSGNALRHRMIREPGALHLVKTCGLEGKLTLDQANYLFNGGTLTDSSPTENLARIGEMQELLPLIRLLGGSLRNQVVGGSLIAGRGILICEENRETIEKMLPDDFKLPESRLRSCEDFIDQYQYTRGDARKRKDAHLIIDEMNNDGSNLMIYSGQSIIPGAIFYHQFIMQNISTLEIGALLNALYEWDMAGATIGGSARIGHGKLQTYFLIDMEKETPEEVDPKALATAYRKHCEDKKEKITEWLFSTFPQKMRKTA